VLARGREDTVSGPSVTLQAAAMLSDAGVVSRTGTYVEVLVVDCSAEVVHFLRPFVPEEEEVAVTDGFDEESLLFSHQ